MTYLFCERISYLEHESAEKLKEHTFIFHRLAGSVAYIIYFDAAEITMYEFTDVFSKFSVIEELYSYVPLNF